jgi:diaminohydroxyphosphoribosylaminopyrimidine deaminase/5-amino-6-(5-phosphoribosylamino)uracil reductase
MNSLKKISDATDRRFIKLAIALARRGLGTVSPNPTVGCVLVSPEGIVVGRGWTQPGGRPHAEAEALRRAGARAKGATAYVTLEPCSHTGRTPPCADALIKAGVARVVGAIEDPDPRVSGRGFARLTAAGIEVSTNLFADEVEEVNAGFLLHRVQGRPLVTLKVASTLDGRVSTHRGESQWITGAAARRIGHMMRMTHDAIVVGIGTALADDPELTCRLPGLEEYSPVRVVLDTRLQLPLSSKLVRTALETPTWVAVSAETEADKRAVYEDLGVVVLPFEVDGDHHPEPIAILKALGARGLTRVLVEGGSAVAAALMRANLIDRMAWFRASSVMGAGGTPAIAAFGVDALSEMRRFELITSQSVGDDRLETYRIAD